MPIQWPRFVRFQAVVVAAALSTAVPLAAQTAQTANTASSFSAPPIRIDNFARVSPSYYRGAMPIASDINDLASLGVKTVIDLTGTDGNVGERALVEQAGMKFLKIPMSTRREPTAGEISQFLSVVQDPANQPVYVHCVGGRHRTGVMTAVYRMNQDDWSADQAFREMKKYKYGADFLHPEFKRVVYAYEPTSRTEVARAVDVPAGAGDPIDDPSPSTTKLALKGR